MKELNAPSDVRPKYLSMGSWQTRRRKTPSSEQGEKRKAKRARLGNTTMRKLYIHAKAYKFPEYAKLCARADGLNGRK